MIKDMILINSGFSNDFWAKVMKTINYFCNKLLIKNKNHDKIIPKKAWTG